MSVTVNHDDLGVRFDGTAAWGNNEAANSVKTISVPISGAARRSKKYAVVVYNPGASAVVVNIQAGEVLAAGNRFANTATAITVAAGATVITVLPDLFVGALAQITLQNSTVIGAAGAFTATIRIRELED